MIASRRFKSALEVKTYYDDFESAAVRQIVTIDVKKLGVV